MSENNQDLGLKPLLINASELAKMVGVSKGWVYQNKHRILGAQKVGGSLRFNLDTIRRAVASGKNIVFEA
jgi:hypothetical protein